MLDDLSIYMVCDVVRALFLVRAFFFGLPQAAVKPREEDDVRPSADLTYGQASGKGHGLNRVHRGDAPCVGVDREEDEADADRDLHHRDDALDAQVPCIPLFPFELAPLHESAVVTARLVELFG